MIQDLKEKGEFEATLMQVCTDLIKHYHNLKTTPSCHNSAKNIKNKQRALIKPLHNVYKHLQTVQKNMYNKSLQREIETILQEIYA